MPIYHRTLNGRKVWHVRVSYKGRAMTRVCATKSEAGDVERALAQGAPAARSPRGADRARPGEAEFGMTKIAAD